MSKIKIAFSGMGAVGGYYGTMLTARTGRGIAEIYFIARGENLRVIKEDGLFVKTGSRKIKAKPFLVTDNPAEIGPVDYIFCCTKGYDLKENIEQLKPLLGRNTVIVPLLNGIDIAEQIQKMVPGYAVWKGCTYIGTRLVRPGYINKFSDKDRLFFGSKEGGKGRQKSLLALFNFAHVNATNPEDIDTHIWKKFMMISPAAAVTSFYNQNIHKALEEHYDLFLTLGSELKSVATAKGINLPKTIVHAFIDAQKMMPPGATTSMHADMIAGKPTEVENLIGYVIRTADELGLEIPTYRFIYKGLTEFK